MNASPSFEQLFFALYEGLPRQGPGNRASAARALALCAQLPPRPSVLDVGCGVGGQTLQLAELIDGPIVAIDNHAPSIARLQSAIAERGLDGRIHALVADMADPPLSSASFDLVWSEGALYSIGLRNALRVCHRLLRPEGYLVFTDAIWRCENPPAEVRASFDADYPTMGSLGDDIAAIADCGFTLVDHFTLPDEAWWEDFYTPMEARIGELRDRHRDDDEASAILDRLAEEPELHRRHADCYAYEFFVARPLANATR
jgi:SAM-dependent methyltransferase